MSNLERGEVARLILEGKNMWQKVVLTEEMVDMEVILNLFQIKTYGHFIILNLKDISKLKMVLTVVNQEVLEQMVRIN